MRQGRMMSRFAAMAAIALALSAGACGKKKSKATPSAGSGSGSVAGSAPGSAAPGSDEGSAPTAPPVLRSVSPQEAVDAPDRPAEDKALDAGRRPVELLTFL